MSQPPIIDHDPNETHYKPSLLGRWWWAAWVMLAAFWIMQIRDGLDIEQICLGFLTGGILLAWAIDMLPSDRKQ